MYFTIDFFSIRCHIISLLFWPEYRAYIKLFVTWSAIKPIISDLGTIVCSVKGSQPGPIMTMCSLLTVLRISNLSPKFVANTNMSFDRQYPNSEFHWLLCWPSDHFEFPGIISAESIKVPIEFVWYALLFPPKEVNDHTEMFILNNG